MNQDRPVLTVSQLTNAIKHCLESTFPAIWLQGEISNCKKHSSGHIYFSLKDNDAQISAVMFRGSASKLSMSPKDGDQVMVYGGINVYPPSGKYQILVQNMRFAGVGELLQKLEELKQKLHKKGWFSPNHKKPLPSFPKRIGVVTSPTGAAIQDILNVLTRRYKGFHLILNPVRVQGAGAAEEIAQAIRQFNEYDLVDVMIIGRGGGSIEDLWAFNEEIVAEAIFESKIPIIAAVGHETDHAIAEYVADVRAPTPSAAAEIVVKDLKEQLQHLDRIHKSIKQSILHLFENQRNRLQFFLKQPVFQSPYNILGPWMQKTDDLRASLDLSIRQIFIRKKMEINGFQKRLLSLNPKVQIQNLKKSLFQLEKQLQSQWRRIVLLQTERLNKLKETLAAVDPKNVLKRGYSICLSKKSGSVINSIHNIHKQQDVRMLFSDGEALSTIKEISPYE